MHLSVPVTAPPLPAQPGRIRLAMLNCTDPLDPPHLDAGQPEPRPRILIVDDDFDIRLVLSEILRDQACEVALAENLTQAREQIEKSPFDTVILDVYLGGDEMGLSLIPWLHERQPNTPVVVISGLANMDDVLVALKTGAYDMLTKPFNNVDVVNGVARAVEKKRMADQNEALLAALRRERDLLEERVRAATHEQAETIEMLRLINEQVAAMFELSQAAAADSTTEEVVRRVFELLGRMIDFQGGVCVLYDLRARGINLTYSQGERAEGLARIVGRLLAENTDRLILLAEQPNGALTGGLKEHIDAALGPDAPARGLMLMPLYVRQTLLGVVGLIRPHTAMPLDGDDERMLSLAISHLLAALEQRSFIARTAQLSGLGELISEIAHDLRHPMTALRGAARMLIDGWRIDEKRERCLEELTANLSRMESLVAELVNFYNPREMNMVPVDLHGLLDRALEASSHYIEQGGIELERRYAPGQPMILGLTRNLMEAFINVITNACQAMAGGGKLTVTTEANLNGIHEHRLRGANLQPGGYLCVSIRDTGGGIPEEDHEKVFKRFYTTKPEGHGLGLSAVMRIMRKNLGHVAMESRVGEGTTFHLYLPKT